MSLKNSNMFNELELKSYSDDSYRFNELNQIPSSNNNIFNQNDNIILNDVNESIFGEGKSINNSIYNYSYSKIFNFSYINEIDRSTNIGNKETSNKEEINLKNKALFRVNKLGRKKKNDNAKSRHNKYSDDNLRRKVKCIVLKNIMKFINEKINEIYKGNIGYNIYRKQLFIINGNQNSNISIEFNQNFLNKKLGDIFSVNISTRYTDHGLNHNKKLIEDLKKEEDENKRLYFNKFFNLTFLQCLNHYIGLESIAELNGLTCFNEDKNTMDEDEEYIKILCHYIKTYEERIMNKKKRPKRNIQKS